MLHAGRVRAGRTNSNGTSCWQAAKEDIVSHWKHARDAKSGACAGTTLLQQPLLFKLGAASADKTYKDALGQDVSW